MASKILGDAPLLLLIKRSLDHFDQSGFFADRTPASLSGIVKLVQLPVAPLGLDVRGERTEIITWHS